MTDLLTNDKNDQNSSSLSDEDILNVFREKNDTVLRTREIAEELPITQTWTGNRLNELETEGRVHSKSAGQGRVWWLDDDEPNRYVTSGAGDLMLYAITAERLTTIFAILSTGTLVFAGLLMVPVYLFEAYLSGSSGLISSEVIAIGAIVFGLAGAAFLSITGLLKLFSVVIKLNYTGQEG